MNQEMANTIVALCDEMNDRIQTNCIHFILASTKPICDILNDAAYITKTIVIGRYTFDVVVDEHMAEGDGKSGDIWVYFGEEPK